MACISVPPKPTEFTVYADEEGHVYVTWSLVSGASGYTIYWCHHHVHVQRCAVCLTRLRLMLSLEMIVLQSVLNSNSLLVSVVFCST